MMQDAAEAAVAVMERIQRGGRSGRVNQWRQWLLNTTWGDESFFSHVSRTTLGATYATVKDHGIQYVQEKTYREGCSQKSLQGREANRPEQQRSQ
jgi:hypothetical protein